MSGKKGGNSSGSQRSALNAALQEKGKEPVDREKNMKSSGSEEHSRQAKRKQK